MDERQLLAVNHRRGIWPGTCCLQGLYTKCIWISAEEFKFQGGYSSKMATSGPISYLTGYSWESCRWVKSCVIVCYQNHNVELHVWTFNQWEATVFHQRLWLVAEIALVHQCVLAGELIWSRGVVVNKDVACFMNARQLLVLQEWGTFYNAELWVAPLCDPRILWSARCDVEIVDGSHHWREGDVVDADTSTLLYQGYESREDIAVTRLGRQSNPWDRPESRIHCHRIIGTFLWPVDRLTAVRIIAAAV